MFNGKKDQWTLENDLQKWVETFIVDRRTQNMSKGTIYFYRKKLELFEKFCKGRGIAEITELTPTDIREYLLHLEETGHNQGGCHACFRALKTFLNWWEEEAEPDDWHNPIKKVKGPKLTEEPLDPASTDDVFEMVATCKHRTFHGDRDRAILLTLLDSGVRATELITLDYGDIDLTDGAILVKQGKGRKYRVTFAGKKARKAIRAWLKHRGMKAGPFFTTTSGERLTYWGLREILRRRAAQAGVIMPSAHDFRRAFCLAQLQAGVPETTIARLMGHSTTHLIARYAKQTRQNLGEMFRSLADEKL